MSSTVTAEGVLEPECLTALIMWLFTAEAASLDCTSVSSDTPPQGAGKVRGSGKDLVMCSSF